MRRPLHNALPVAEGAGPATNGEKAMRSSRRGRYGVVLSMMFVAGLAVAALTSHTAGEVRADDHQIELVSIEAEGGEAQSSVDQSEATYVASTVVEEPDTPKVKKSSCSRASK